MTGNQQLAERIMERMDASRLDCQGGYPSEWVFRGQDIIIASINHNGAPTLTVETVAEFVRENSEWLEHDWP